MALLITSTVCGLCALLAALMIQLSLPGWMLLAGLSRIPADRLGNIDIPRLRSRLSAIMYLLAAACLGGALVLYFTVLPETFLLPLYFLLALVLFNVVWFVYRKCDRNVYSDGARRVSRIFVVFLDVSFLLVCFLFIR